MRLSDEVRSTSQEKKRYLQLQHANRMIRTQGKDVENQGGGDGAVVTVMPDYRAVSHNIGIMGVIYEMKSTGGARVVTVAGTSQKPLLDLQNLQCFPEDRDYSKLN
jgi:hypothetical protein